MFIDVKDGKNADAFSPYLHTRKAEGDVVIAVDTRKDKHPNNRPDGTPGYNPHLHCSMHPIANTSVVCARTPLLPRGVWRRFAAIKLANARTGSNKPLLLACVLCCFLVRKGGWRLTPLLLAACLAAFLFLKVAGA